MEVDGKTTKLVFPLRVVQLVVLTVMTLWTWRSQVDVTVEDAKVVVDVSVVVEGVSSVVNMACG